MENQLTTNNTTNLPDEVANMQKLPALLEAYIPKMEKRKAKAIAVLDSLTKPVDDDEAETFIRNLAAVREVYKANNEMRMQMTAITDSFKDMTMDYERDLNPDAKAKSKYNEKKKLLEQYEQEKHDARQKEIQEQAKRKDVENLKVEIRSGVSIRLTDMLNKAVKQADDGSRDFFDKTPLEAFDKRAEAYKGMKPKLKQEDYDACFTQPYPANSPQEKLIPPGDFKILIESIKAEEPHQKWNDLLLEKVGPIINEWRARIPDLKAKLQEVAALREKSSAEADELVKKQKEEEEKKQLDRQAALDNEAAEAKRKIEREAEMSKMSNSFAEQGAIQNLGDAGKIKLVTKFSDPAKAPNAFLEIVYQCMMHPEFQSQYPVFQKRDKSKKLVVDDKGRPEYIEAVQWFLAFWTEHCDGNIVGIQMFEDSKVTIRK